jgi:hypothetical protein
MQLFQRKMVVAFLAFGQVECFQVAPRRAFPIILKHSGGGLRQNNILPSKEPYHLNTPASNPNAPCHIIARRMKSEDDSSVVKNSDGLIQETSLAIGRTSWFSWWTQVILTVVSSVTLIFSRSVLNTLDGSRRQPVGFFLAGSGESSVLQRFSIWGESIVPISNKSFARAFNRFPL